MVKNNNLDQDIISNSIRMYLNEIKKIPRLSLEEEKEWSLKLAENDQEAKKKLIEGNLGLVVSIAKRYRGYGLAILDLIQEGNLGLNHACEKYQYNDECRFSTYAYFWIKCYINRAVRKNGRMIRLPEYLYLEMLKYRKIQTDLEKRLERKVTVYEMSKYLNISYEKSMLLSNSYNDSLSLNELNDDSENSHNTTLLDYIASDEKTLDEIVIEKDTEEKINLLLEKTNLTERERNIICCHYGINGDECMTLEEIGKKYGITRERVRQIEFMALKKMRRSPIISAFKGYFDDEKHLVKRI